MKPLTVGSRLRAFLMKQDRQRAATNICLDGCAGGPLHIANQKELHAILGDAMTRGEAFFINEMRTPFFKMFFDVDLRVEEAGATLSDAQLDQVVSVLMARIKLRYPMADGPLLTVIIAGQKQGQAPSSKSANLHVHFPNLIVNSEEACAIATDVVAHLPDLDGVTSTWQEAIDHQVYTANGLRMLGSCKPDVCPAKCGGVLQDCAVCGNKGRVNLGRVYMVRACYTNGERNAEWLSSMQANHAMALKACSVRNDVLPLTSTGARPPCDGFTAAKKKKAKIDNSPQAVLVQRALRELGYAQLVVTKCTELKVGELLCVDVDGPGSKACGNLKSGEHGSSSVWFLLTPKGFSQRCRCKKDTLVNRGVLCSAYKSKWMPVSAEVVGELFPNYTPEKKAERAVNIKATGQTMHPAMRRVFEHYQNVLHGEPEPKKRKKAPFVKKSTP